MGGIPARIAFFLFAALFVAAPVCGMDAGMKQKLAVLPFIPKNMEAMTVTESLSSLLLSNLDRTGHFEIIERKKIEGMIELEGLRFEHLTRDDLVRIGRKNGIDFILSGSAMSVGSSLALDLQLLSTKREKVCVSDTVRLSQTELSTKIYDTAKELVNSSKECSSAASAIARQQHVQAPSDLRAGGTSKSIRLFWSHPDVSKLIGFKIFRAGSESGSFSTVATTTETVYVDDNLNLNETFYYKVQAIGNTGAESEQSQVVMGKTSIAPHPPIFLGVKADIKSAHLQWRSRPSKGKEGGTEEAGYKIYRKTAQDKDFRESASAPADASSYTDTGLKDGTAYLYTLTAFNSNKAESEFATTLDVVTVSGMDALKAEAGKIRHVPLSWNAHINDTVEGYNIYRSADKDGEYKKAGSVSGRMTVSFTDSGLEDKKIYWYRIAAYNKANSETDKSQPVSVETRDVPPQVKGLSAKSGEVRKVSIAWEPVNSPADEIRGYRIYRSMEDKGEFKKIGDVDSDRKASFTDDDKPLKDNTAHFYRITCYNSANAESPVSAVVSAVTKALPKTPAGLKAKSGEVKKVSLDWDKNPEPDIKEYLVHRKRSDEKEYDKVKTVREGISYSDTDLKDGMEYSYKIQAVDKDGLVSEMSEAVSAKTKPLPNKPAGLKLSEKDGKKALSWDANAEKDIKGYNVYKKGFLGGGQNLASVQGTLWVIDELKDRTEFFITAVDETGLESERSEVVVVEKK
ncbi:MAG: hypothetical protein EPN22_06000 [Nitrospirae bacterium]|nr:MAG: hypothetical protein EPN22_06000 [Nitrospirota bacterium]